MPALTGRFLLFAFLVIPTLSLCQITASDTSGCAPLVNVTFTSPPGATGINWDFDDGTSSNLASPVHTFITAGTYNVVYTATIGGNPVVYSLTVYVYGKPSVFFGAFPPLSGCVPLNVSFKDSSSGGGGSSIVGREWSFGDGGVNVGNNANPSYNYVLPGSFTVSLKITDANGCDSAFARPAYINTSTPPNAVISSNPFPPSSCNPPLAVSFSAALSTSNSPSGSTLTYLWNLGGGNTSQAMNPPIQNYAGTGIFPITLTVTDNTGCASTIGTNVVIANPVASFYAAGAVNDTVCNLVLFQNTSTGLNPFFSYGDGTFGVDTFHTYINPGTYQVNLQVQTGSCIDDTTITIVVQQVVAEFTSSPTYSCSWPNVVQFTNQSINGSTYDWTFADGAVSVAQNPTHTFFEADTNEFTIYTDYWIDTTMLVITSQYGCIDTVIHTDSIFKPTARFMPDVAWGCAPLTVTFSDSSLSKEPIVNWKWRFGDGTNNNGTNTVVTHTYNNPGVYYATLIITNSAGCIDTSYAIAIHVGEPAATAFSVTPTTVCVNTPVQFTDLTPAIDPVNYWHFSTDAGIMSHCYTDSTPTWSFNSMTGLQDITLTTVSNGCNNTFTIQNAINVKGPLAHFVIHGDCATPHEYSFDGDIQDADYWTWDFGDGVIINNSTATTISHTYTSTGDFDVVLTAYNNTSGCPPYIDSAKVYVRDIQASFTSVTQACADTKVYFDASSSTDVNGSCHEGFLWYWGDNQHPHNTENDTASHTYDVGGIYSVKLVVTDINGCIDTIRNTIQIYDVQAAFFPDKLYGCLPLTVNFTDSSYADTTIVQWEWNFGDGTTSNIQNPTHIYTQTGVYFWMVQLIITTELGCKDTMVLIIRPSIPDASFFVLSSNNICVGDSVLFSANSSIVDYQWDFGNGTTSILQTASSTYNIAGMYTVSLIVTDSIGCTSSNVLSNYVSVQDYPIAAFVSSADTLFNKCYPLLVTFTDTSIVNVFGSRNWDLGNGSATVGNPSVGTIYQLPGTYTITLTEITTNGCSDTISKSITVEGPVGNFDIVPDSICRGETITFTIKDTADVLSYHWDFGDGTTAPGTSPINHTFYIHPSSGQTIVSLVMWSPDSACNATTTHTVYIYPVIADFSITNNDSIYCLNEPIIFNNLSQNASGALWIFGDGTNYIGQNPPPHLYSAPGMYQVSLAITNTSNGCSDTMVQNLLIYGIPDAIAVGGDTCQGDPVQLTASGGIGYVWTPSAGLSADTIQNPVATPLNTTNYLVTVYDSVGCTDTASALVIIYEPITEVHLDTLIIIGEEVQLNAYQGPGYSYSWSPATGLSCTTCPNPIAQPLVNTVYSVTIQDDAGCYSVTSTYEFVVKPITTIDVPTAFTPNGDGDNDIIFVDGLGIKKLIEFKIFNRWGQLLFETNDISKGWDGFYMGELQNVETYMYLATAETWAEGKVLTKKGSFNLIR